MWWQSLWRKNSSGSVDGLHNNHGNVVAVFITRDRGDRLTDDNDNGKKSMVK